MDVKEYCILLENIKHYRKRLNITQEKLAELSELSVSYIKQIESGYKFKNVSFLTLIKISKALEIEVSELLKENILITN